MLRALSIVAFAAMVLGIVGLFYIDALFARRPWLIAIQIAMVALMVWARVVFGRRSFHAAATPTAGRLITTGPYAYLRHPIYAAVIHFAWCGALDTFSWSSVGWAETVTAGAFIRMHVEEYMLKKAYPEYEDYRRRVKKVVPFLY